MKNNNLRFLLVILCIAAFGVLFAACSGTPGSNNGTNAQNGANKKPALDPSKLPPGSSPAWSKGAPNAVVTIEEFADFQCPTCGAMHPKVQEIRAAFGDRIRIIFREFPLQGHQWGFDAACAAEAAGMQGKFWEMQNQLFSNQAAWSTAPDARKIFADYAEKLGLDTAKYSDDVIGIMVKNRVQADMERGKALGVSSTPSFFINNKLYDGDLNSLKAAIEAELKKAEAASQTPNPAGAANSTSNAAPASNSNTNK